ncbi:MAG: AAA family ATPase [Anaerolineae bacterium]|jgi:DNA-binding SARP family transcriptional activator
MNGASDDRTLHIKLLGDFRLAYGDEPVVGFDTPRLQSLLAYLLLHREAPQSRHRLAFLFWPDSPESQALTNLRNLIFRIRHQLPDADRFLSIDRNTVQWRSDAPFDLDVAGFEGALARADQAIATGPREADQDSSRLALEQAVALYAGGLLPSCYDDWIHSERQRLEGAFGQALESLARLLEDRQEYDAAIRFAGRLLRQDALHEDAYRRLMRLYALKGDRARALRIYHQCATVLDRELGVEPSRPTRAVYEQLLALEDVPEPPAPLLGQVATASPLVGRQGAWGQLRNAWRIASRGRPQLVLITGEAGIGKTRLAEDLVQWAARQGIATASARCYASEGELAYGPVAAWLRALPLPEMEPDRRTEVARIFPQILVDLPQQPRPGPLVEAWQRRRFFEALARTVLGAAQPLLLFIDALQWCDRRTLEWLHYLLRFDPRAHLLIVGAARPAMTANDAPLTSLLHGLRRDEQLTEIPLSPLTLAETGTLATHVSGRKLGQNLLECLYGETEGNPLFIVETVRAGLPDEVLGSAEEGFICVPRPLPSRVTDALMARVAQLSPLARSLAELAATIGREFTFSVLANASDRDEDALVRVLDELWRYRILREQGEDAYDFSHDKLREVLYGALSLARRRMLHRHVARALERVHANSLDAVAARIASHYERADEPAEAIRYYQRAAEVADGMQCQERAILYSERASTLREVTTDTAT